MQYATKNTKCPPELVSGALLKFRFLNEGKTAGQGRSDMQLGGSKGAGSKGAGSKGAGSKGAGGVTEKRGSAER